MKLLREWRDIPLEWAQNYEVSNYGEIRNKKRNTIRKYAEDDTGYYNIIVWYQGKAHQLYAHQAVALAFVENPDPEHKTIVSHLDESKTNNRADNLAWATLKENANMPLLKIRRNKDMTNKPVAKLDLEGNIIETYTSVRQAALANNRNYSSVSKCVRGERDTCAGYKWKYLDQEDDNEDTQSNNG